MFVLDVRHTTAVQSHATRPREILLVEPFPLNRLLTHDISRCKEHLDTPGHQIRYGDSNAGRSELTAVVADCVRIGREASFIWYL